MGEAPRERSFLSILVTATAVLVAVGLAAVLIWKWQHVGQAISANTQAASEIKTPEAHLQEAEPGVPAPPLEDWIDRASHRYPSFVEC